MVRSVVFLSGALCLPTLAIAVPHSTPATVNSSAPNFNAPPPANLSLLANGSLYYQWRSQARFTFPSDSLADPTALWQDSDGTFRINALHSNFNGANVSLTNSIAGATTKDFLVYEDYHNYTNSVSIGPGGRNDPIAVFDGSVIPKGYKGLPTLIYTGAHYTPIYWADFYITGAETQNLAYSEDNGETWIKLDIPPLIPQAPSGYNVTGFRDAWAFQYPQIASLLGDDADTWYLTVSSGIHGIGPRIFLYRCNSSDFLDWQYLGPAVKTVVNTTTSPGGFSGNDGSNYECGNTLALDHNGDNITHGVTFLTMGAESGRETHSHHYSLWKMGKFVKDNGTGVILDDHATGVLDWGVGYACATLPDEQTGRRLVFCWNNEDFNTTNTPNYVIGAAGGLSVPRELFFKEITNVVADDYSMEPGYWSVVTDGLNTVNATEGVKSAIFNGDKTVNLGTLGCRPAKEVEQYRDYANHTWSEGDVSLSPFGLNGTGAQISNNGLVTNAFIPFSQSPRSRRWELQATVEVPASSLRQADYQDFAAGFTILRNNQSLPADWPAENSSIIYRPTNESFMVTRDLSISRDFLNKDPEVGRIRLWESASGNGSTTYEKLKIRAFLDGSFFEVYVNDVMTITTRVYYWYEDSTDMGFYLQWPTSWTTGNSTRDTTVSFSNVTVWEGAPNVWPYRPTAPELLIQNKTGFLEPANNPNLPLYYDGVGSPPLPPTSAVPTGLSASQLASID